MINGAPKDEAPKAPTTPTLTAQKKDTPTCYCRDVHWFQDCPYINELARPKDWKPDKVTAKKVEERIASALDWIKSKIEKLRPQASEKGVKKEPDGTFAVQHADAQNAGIDYPLRDSVILDNATSIHVINDRSLTSSDQVSERIGLEWSGFHPQIHSIR